MDTFIDLLSRYARAWEAMSVSILSGKRDAAIAAAREVLDIASKLDAEQSRIEVSGGILPQQTLMPYDYWHGETARQLSSPDGLSVKGGSVPFPFTPEEIGIEADSRY